MHPKIFTVTFPFHVQYISGLEKKFGFLMWWGGCTRTPPSPWPNSKMIAILLLMIIIHIYGQLKYFFHLKLYHWELHQDDRVRFKVTDGVKNIHVDHFHQNTFCACHLVQYSFRVIL